MKNGNNADLQYLALAQQIFQTGVDRRGRNGVTRGVFTREFRWDLRDGFPLLTTKKVAMQIIAAELLWFLDAGRETGWRLDNNKLRGLLGYPSDKATIWSNDSENPEKAWVKDGHPQFPGDCGRIYGAQWRNWKNYDGTTTDQLSDAIAILRNDPYNRRNIVTAWNPGDLKNMCLPPCHRDFTFYVAPDADDKPALLSMQMVQRSCDLFLGVPFNIASYALLLSMVAQVACYTAHELVITFLDVHIYEEHFEKFGEQFARQSLPLPSLWLNPEITKIDDFTMDDIGIVGYAPHSAIKAVLK